MSLHRGPARRAGILSIVAAIAVGLSCGDRDAVLPTALPESVADPVMDTGAAAVPESAGAITFVSAAGQHSSGSSIALPRPAALEPGDVMIAQIVAPGAVQVGQAPAGWTLVRGDHDATHSSSWVYWKRAGDAEPSSYAWSLTGSVRSAGGIGAYRGVSGGTAPIEAHGGQHTGAGTNITAPSITTTTPGAWLVALFSAASEPRETSLAFTPPAGMTEHYDVSSQMKGNQRNVVAMQASAAAATTGATGTRTAALNAARPGWGQLLALVPGPAAPPPSNRPPVASAGGPYTGQEGTAVAFDGSASTDPDGDALTFSWSFGDGSSGTGAKPSHTYVDNGSFAVVLTVTDSHGATHESATTATIANVPPAATLGLSAASVGIGQSITATGGFSDPGTADAPWSWEIEWGDGSRTSGTAAPGSAISAQHAWSAAATYTVRLSVTDKDGGSGSAQAAVVVTDGGGTDTWHTDFREYATGQLPAGWSQPYATGNWHIAELAGSTGGKVLRNTIPVKDFFVLRWDVPGAQTDVELESVARVVDGRNGSMGLVARGQPGRTFYTLRLDEGTSQWRLARYTSGSSHYFAQWNNPFPAGTWVSRRFRVEGNTLKAKIWAAGTPEPADWTLQAVDPAPLGGGFAGVFMRVPVTTNDFDWVRVTAIGDPSPPPPPPPTAVEWAWSGAQTPQGARVRVRLSAADAGVRLRISTDSLFRTWTETTSAATGGNDVATFDITGLSANTRYHYRPVVAGADQAAFQGAFRTLPPAGSAHSFTFALGACQLTETTSLVFDNIRATAPLFWLQTGDIHYRNIAVNDIDAFRHAYNSLHAHAPQAALFRSTPIVHAWDDHDGAGGNDTDRTKTGWPAVKAAYRESVPHHPLVEGAGGAIYHSFVVGRVRFIVSDLRSERSPKTQLDDSRKTMLGATQKAHLKAELADAKANGQFIAWVTSVPWIAAPTAGADHWGGYDTERRELADWIESLGISGQMFALAGDMHALAIDSGANNQWGAFPIFHAAPVHQSSSTKGGPYTHGPFTTTSSGGQFGVVSITDNGGSTIQVTFNGRRFAGAVTGATHSFTLRLQ